MEITEKERLDREERRRLPAPAGQNELRAERLGTALRGLAAQLVDERRKVAELRRENRKLKAQLERRQPAQEDEPARRSGSPADI